MRASRLSASRDAKHTNACATTLSHIDASSWAQHGHSTWCHIPLCRSDLRYVGVGELPGAIKPREPSSEREVKRPTPIRPRPSHVVVCCPHCGGHTWWDDKVCMRCGTHKPIGAVPRPIRPLLSHEQQRPLAPRRVAQTAAASGVTARSGGGRINPAAPFPQPGPLGTMCSPHGASAATFNGD